MPDQDRRQNEARGYSCMRCNKWYALDDPAFAYYRPGRGRLEGQLLDGRDGRPLDTYGWFARCADADACDRRRRNVHAGVAPEQIAMCDV